MVIKKIHSVARHRRTPRKRGQLEFTFDRPQEHDRNHHLGGKSFYFFDFDDNVAYLTTPIVIFHKDTGEERLLSSGEWAHHHRDIGKSGPFIDYFIDYHDNGSFRYFRDSELSFVQRAAGARQSFLHDIEKALEQADYSWKAPSWNCFYHATFNQRPTSLITARGHQKGTIMKGIELMVKQGHLPKPPNYLSIFPVTNPDVRHELGDKDLCMSVADLKRSAIAQSVEMAINKYGHSPYHRFGMSDDDPHNVELITEEMRVLKRKYPEMSFFVIQTYKDKFVKREVLENRTRTADRFETHAQLKLF